MTHNDIQREVDENFEEFQRLMPALVGQHKDQFALMKGRSILVFFSTAHDGEPQRDYR